MTTRWNDFGGSPDVMYDFASQPYSGTPEEAARAFVMQNAGIFGVTELNNFRVFSSRNALGGHLVRFQQTFNGVAVENGGIGIVMNANKQVIMASGPFFRDVAVNTQPSLSAEQARTAADNDLNQFYVGLPAAATNLLQNGLSILSQQLAAVAEYSSYSLHLSNCGWLSSRLEGREVFDESIRLVYGHCRCKHR